MSDRYKIISAGGDVVIHDTMRDLCYHIGYIEPMNPETIGRLVARAFERGRKQRSRELSELIGDS